VHKSELIFSEVIGGRETNFPYDLINVIEIFLKDCFPTNLGAWREILF
jgi:hypothetical protein